MGILMSSVVAAFLPKKLNTILMLGLDGAGKTTILYRLKLDEEVTTVPTFGYNIETIHYKKNDIVIWDIGGQNRNRPLWRHYYFNNNRALIYVIDLSDSERMALNRETLHGVLASEQLRNIPVLIFANKMDSAEVNVSEIADKLGMTSLNGREWTVQPSCGKTGKGLYSGLDWIIRRIPLE